MFTTLTAPSALNPKARWLARIRQLSVLAMAAFTFACAETPEFGNPGFVSGFSGAVVADEPAAALAGRDVLSSGGTAGDAAAAVFFVLSVTKPAAAGLMTSGLCVAADTQNGEARAFRFSAPAGVRAMAALHARFGSLPWRQVVSPAEKLARFGFNLSKSFVNDWQAAAPGGQAARAIFGSQIAVGQKSQNLALAALLGRIRENGAGAFHNGPFANQMIADIRAAGHAVDRESWRRAIPETADANLLEIGNHKIAVAPFAGSAGARQAALWPLIEDSFSEDLPGASARTGSIAPRAAIHETGFVAADSLGGAVACSISMGRPYGTGRLASGMFLADRASPSTGPLLIFNEPTKSLLAAAAGAGAPGWPLAIAAAAVDDDEPLPAQIRNPRAVSTGAGGFLAEQGSTLLSNNAQKIEKIGRVNAIVCRLGLPNYAETCVASADPRGQGFAAIDSVQ